MKRNAIKAIAAILTATLILCACNQDAMDGIYSQVASSTESKNVITIAYLGQYNSNHYYLADDGVFCLNTEEAVIKSGNGKIIRRASIDDSGNLYLLVDETDSFTSSLYQCTIDNPNFDNKLNDGESDPSYSGLMVNGLLFNDSGVYTVGAPTATLLPAEAKVNYHLETENYAFFSVKEGTDYKFYVFKDGAILSGFNGIAGDDTTYSVFQPIDDSTFLLVTYYDKNSKFYGYKLTSAGVSEDSWFTLVSSLTHSNAQSPSFFFTMNGSNYVAIKCNKYFDIVSVDEPSNATVAQLRTGFATELRTSEVTNILKTADDNIFVVGTYNSLLYKVDMNYDSFTETQYEPLS